MEQKMILYPVLALVGWSFVVTGVMLARAFKAVGAGLSVEYFRYGAGAEPPGYMRAAYQHYSNLFEMPVLFYTAALISYVAGVVDALLVTLAWAYVATRLLHGTVHMRDRNVLMRRNTFFLSMLVLVSLWVLLAARVLQM
ncbi:MAPEG family protein [Ectothiorhodospiraceae bacterium 2226]|nr:MAPEG family protein [Ectothiorhodospiraceae bacterium 2226]